MIDSQGKGADGAGIFGDLFADAAVAAGDGLLEESFAVAGGEGEAIHFEFGDVAVGRSTEQFAHARIEGAEFPFIECVAEAEHLRTMGRFAEALTGFAAHAHGGRIGCGQFGMQQFELLQFAHERVVFLVADFRSVEDVIQMFVAAQGCAQGCAKGMRLNIRGHSL